MHTTHQPRANIPETTYTDLHRVSHSAKVNVYGMPFIREMPKISGIAGRDLTVKCPVAGYPIDKIHWERGECVEHFRFVFCVHHKF